MNSKINISTKNTTAIDLNSVTKIYVNDDFLVEVLKGVSLEIRVGDFVALMGPSGSGKSTLLNIIAGLDRATDGEVIINGRSISLLSDDALTHWRGENVGVVLQSNNLIPVLTSYQNVELPLILAKVNSKERRERVMNALTSVGLSERATHYPRQLSGGEEQRVAIARAIVKNPSFIVVDEPTGNLDRENANEILKLFQDLNKSIGTTILMVTHDPSAADYATRTLKIDKGVML